MEIGNGIKRFLHGVGKTAAGGFHLLSDAYHFVGKARRYWKIWLVMGIALFYLFVSIAVYMLNPIQSFVDAFASIPKGIEYYITETEALFQFISSGESGIDEDELVGMDLKMIQTVLGKVLEYNREIGENRELAYTKRTYKGRIVRIDDITGEVVVEPNKSDDEGEPGTVEEELEKLDKENKELFGGPLFLLPLIPINGGIFALDGLKTGLDVLPVMEEDEQETPLYTDRLMYEQVDRGKMDKTPFSQDIFEVSWPAVLVMASMYVQTTDREVDFITEEEMEKVMDLFRSTYYYIDDPLYDKQYDSGFDRIEEGNKGYRLFIGNYGDTVEVERKPAIAPIAVVSPVCNSLYEYETLSNGYMRLCKRTFTYTPTRFLAQAKELIPDFDWEEFVEDLRLIPGCALEADFYETFFSGNLDVSETRSEMVCPLIGTMVSGIKDVTQIETGD